MFFSSKVATYYNCYKNKLYISLNIFLVSLLIFLMFLINANFNEYKALKNNAQRLHNQIYFLKQKLNKQSQNQQLYTDANAKFEFLANKFLLNFSIIFDEVLKLSKVHQLQIVNCIPEDEIIKTLFKEQYLNLILEGKYHSIISYISALNRLTFPVNIENLVLERMNGNLNDKNILTLKMKLKIYICLKK